jgi:activating signal cointegrator 1
MKAISLWQPWASAIAVGMKHFETRSWGTSYRGPLAIHAAKRPMTEGERELLEEYPFPLGMSEVPLGAIVATCTLAEVIHCNENTRMDECEDAWGDFSPGRFAWALIDVVPVRPAVPARGAQGLWDWAGDRAEGQEGK